MDLIFVALGLVILLLAGDALVRGAVNVSLRLGIPALIVSLTIVAIGTSAPELLVAVDAVANGSPGLAVGNVVGSNIANVLLVLGVPALLVGFGTAGCDTRNSYLQMLAGTALFSAFAFMTPITWQLGLILVAAFFAIMGYSVYQARAALVSGPAGEEPEVSLDGADPAMRWWKIILFLGLGLIGLPIGANLLVGSATEIAFSFGVSETVIGLSLVALGTSLPELATTITAAFRRHAEVALGNVIGSNIANLLGIIGTASLFGDIPVSSEILGFDLWVMIAASLMIAPFVFFRIDLTRTWGALFTALYVVYIIVVVT